MSSSDQDFCALVGECFDNPKDVSTLTRFYEEFRPYVMAILISMSPPGTRLFEDAYQSAFLKFLKIFLAGAQEGVNYVAYFVVIAKNCLIDELRQQRHRVALDELVDEDFAWVSRDEIERHETRLMLLQGMMRLGQRCQFVLEQYYIAGMTPAKLALHLKIEEQSVYMVLKRCREELKGLLSKC